jgi:hypothetical protein
MWNWRLCSKEQLLIDESHIQTALNNKRDGLGWYFLWHSSFDETHGTSVFTSFQKKIKDRHISATYWMSEETTRLNCITVMSSVSTYQRAFWMRFFFLFYTSVRLSAYKSNLSISTISSSMWVTQSIYPSVFIPLFLLIWGLSVDIVTSFRFVFYFCIV